MEKLRTMEKTAPELEALEDIEIVLVEKLKALEELVKEVLEESVSARKNDCILEYLVCKKLGLNQLLNIPYGIVLWNYRMLNKPNSKSIERCRRRVQAKYPELKEIDTEKARAREEERYRLYATT